MPRGERSEFYAVHPVYPVFRERRGRTLPRLISRRRGKRSRHRLATSPAGEIRSGVLVLTEAESPASSGHPSLRLCARQDSNLQPFGPKPNALSVELRAHMSLCTVKRAYGQCGNEKRSTCSVFRGETFTGAATGNRTQILGTTNQCPNH